MHGSLVAREIRGERGARGGIQVFNGFLLGRKVHRVLGMGDRVLLEGPASPLLCLFVVLVIIIFLAISNGLGAWRDSRLSFLPCDRLCF